MFPVKELFFRLRNCSFLKMPAQAGTGKFVIANHQLLQIVKLTKLIGRRPQMLLPSSAMTVRFRKCPMLTLRLLENLLQGRQSCLNDGSMQRSSRSYPTSCHTYELSLFNLVKIRNSEFYITLKILIIKFILIFLLF